MTVTNAAGSAATGLLVTGVGRSGTSIATQLAASLGLRLPTGDDLMPANFGNPTGYWESRSLTVFNDDLLQRWGSSWWQPPHAVTSEMIQAVAGLRGQATSAFIAAFPSRPWVWKDPRLTVLLPFWDLILGRQPVLFPHRDPREVARSVSVRDGIPALDALAIWERHTRLALATLSGRRCAVVSYEQLCANPTDWRSDLAAFCADAGLPVQVPTSSAEDFVVGRDPRAVDSVSLSPAQECLYEIVRSLDGFHETFSHIDLADEDEAVAATLATINLKRVRERVRAVR